MVHFAPQPDALLLDIADYVAGPAVGGEEALATARLCLMDSIGCAMLSLDFPECTKLLGPVVAGACLPGGAHVPGTDFELDPVRAAFNFGAMIRWLDYNDTWLAAEWAHPSDNLGSILMVADWLSRSRDDEPPLTVRDVLAAMIKAYEIQGVLALENAFNRVGLDHVLLVRIASTAVVTEMLGGTKDQIAGALSNAWIDGGALRTYRHSPNTGTRKCWAAGDATSRAVQLALWAIAGEMGYPTALSTPLWGFQDVLFQRQMVRIPRPLDCYVMENILFKVSFPAEFHGQTAVEAAIELHPLVCDRIDKIERIRIETTESANRIISKTGPLTNPADRDHCLQYMVAIGLLYGTLDSNHYESTIAADSRIDELRGRMQVVANPSYTRDYLDPEKRSITNSIQIFFLDGRPTECVKVEYPLGHRRRRAEARPELLQKFRRNTTTRWSAEKIEQFIELFADPERLDAMSVPDFVDLTNEAAK